MVGIKKKVIRCFKKRGEKGRWTGVKEGRGSEEIEVKGWEGRAAKRYPRYSSQ